MSLFFALLSLLALGLAALAGASLVTSRLAPLRDAVRDGGLWVATAVAATAMAGSLYYSEQANFRPCTYCWYQRIAMYPLVVVLVIAAARRSRDAHWTVVPLATIGAAISIYHYQLQVFPDQGSSCGLDAPCTFRWVEQFGFISIPFMALSGFLAIIALTLAARPEEAPAR